MAIPPNAHPIWSGSGGAVMIDLSGKGLGTFFPHWFEFACLAAQTRDRARQEAAGHDGRPTSEALTAILFSALACEAFVNELGVAASRAATLYPDAEDATAADLAMMLELIEKAHGPIELKYQLASKILSGSMFPRGQAPFQGFANLVTLRNELVHPHHGDKTTPAGHVKPASKIVRDLQQRGLTTTRGRRPDDVPGGVSWLDEIKSGGVASWAYNSAREIIIAVLKMIPEEDDLVRPLVPAGELQVPWQNLAFPAPLFRDRIAQMPT